MRKIDKKLLTRKLTMSGLFLALALIVSVLEGMLPPIIPMLPYAKIGFGNVILLASFLLIGVWEGYIILILRCVFNAIFAGNFSMLLWSLPAAIVAYTIMVLLTKCKIFSITGVSIAGGMVHNFIQMCVAAILVGANVFAYLPYMLLAGGLAGLVTGIICYFITKIATRLNPLKEQEYVREVSQDDEDTPCDFEDNSVEIEEDNSFKNQEDNSLEN